MIYVSAIVGEGFDLKNGKDTPAGIMLSNGIRDIRVELSAVEIRKVIELYSELSHPYGNTPPENTSAPPKPEEEEEEAMMIPVATMFPVDVAAEEDSSKTQYTDPDTGTESV